MLDPHMHFIEHLPYYKHSYIFFMCDNFKLNIKCRAWPYNVHRDPNIWYTHIIHKLTFAHIRSISLWNHKFTTWLLHTSTSSTYITSTINSSTHVWASLVHVWVDVNPCHDSHMNQPIRNPSLLHTPLHSFYSYWFLHEPAQTFTYDWRNLPLKSPIDIHGPIHSVERRKVTTLELHLYILLDACSLP